MADARGMRDHHKRVCQTGLLLDPVLRESLRGCPGLPFLWRRTSRSAVFVAADTNGGKRRAIVSELQSVTLGLEVPVTRPLDREEAAETGADPAANGEATLPENAAVAKRRILPFGPAQAGGL